MEAAKLWENVRHFVKRISHKVRREFRRRGDHLDFRDLASDLEINNLARMDGLRGLPEHEDTHFSGSQAEIVHYFNGLLRHRRQRVIKRYLALVDSHRTLDAASSINRMMHIPTVASNKVFEHESKYELELAKRYEMGVEREQEYERFRQSNGLKRAAYRPQMQWLLAIAIPLFAVVLAHMNAQWMGGYSLQGVLWACAATIVPALIGVYVIRNVNHARPGRFVAATLFGALAVLGIATFALIYEPLVLQGSVSSTTAFLELWATEPYTASGLTDGWVVAVVFGLALLSMLAGYGLNDSYPGFSSISRNMDYARGHYAKLRNRVDAGNLVKVEKYERQLHKRHKATQRQLMKLSKEVDRFRQQVALLSDYEAAVQECCNLLLDQYRECNLAIRGSGDVPLSFSLTYTVPDCEELLKVEPFLRDAEAQVNRELIRLDDTLQAASLGLVALRDRLSQGDPLNVAEAGHHPEPKRAGVRSPIDRRLKAVS